MADKVNSRESGSPQSVLMAVADLKESLTSMIDKERIRLRTLPSGDESTVAERLAANPASPPGPTAERPLVAANSQGSRPSTAADREGALKTPSESKTRASSSIESPLEVSTKSPFDADSARPENPRKRLDELAKLLDKRAKQSAESVLKATEAKEVER